MQAVGRLRTGENKRVANKAAQAWHSTSKYLAQMHAFLDAAYEQGKAERKVRLPPMQSIHLADDRWQHTIAKRKRYPSTPLWWKSSYLEGHYDLVPGSLKTAHPEVWKLLTWMNPV